MPSTTSDPKIKAPRRTGLIPSSSVTVPQKLADERLVALLQLVERSLNQDLAFMNERETIGDSPGSVQIMRHHDRCRLPLLLEREDHLLDLRRGDRIEP